MPDSWEIAYWMNTSSQDGTGDYDLDGLSDLDEFNNQSQPFKGDTDLDGLSDYFEVTLYGTDPTVEDTDGDGFSDYEEIGSSSDPTSTSSYRALSRLWFTMMYCPCKILEVLGAQVPGSDIFSSLGHPYSLGMSSDKLHLNLTGFSFISSPPGSQIFQLDTDGDSISILRKILLAQMIQQLIRILIRTETV